MYLDTSATPFGTTRTSRARDSRSDSRGVGNEGYIRTLPHVLSLVLRLQSYIVTCVYLATLLTHLLYYHMTTPTNRPILRYRSARRSTWHRSLIPSKGLRLDKTVRSNSSVERQIIDVGGPAQASITRKASNIIVTS